jgi:hypothetical protein
MLFGFKKCHLRKLARLAINAGRGQKVSIEPAYLGVPLDGYGNPIQWSNQRWTYATFALAIPKPAKAAGAGNLYTVIDEDVVSCQFTQEGKLIGATLLGPIGELREMAQAEQRRRRSVHRFEKAAAIGVAIGLVFDGVLWLTISVAASPLAGSRVDQSNGPEHGTEAALPVNATEVSHVSKTSRR